MITAMRFLITLLVFSWAAFGQASPAGKWISVLKFFDEPNYGRLELAVTGTRLTGKLDDNAFEGTFQNGRIEGSFKLNPRTTVEVQGILRGDCIEGIGHVAEKKIDLKWRRRANRRGTRAARCISSSRPSSIIYSRTG